MSDTPAAPSVPHSASPPAAGGARACCASLRLGAVVRCPAFAYLTLLALQLKVMWGAWRYRDLTFGDTSSYFAYAYRWYETCQVHFAWSPLYTSFYGSLLHLTTNAYGVTILHRLLIALAATALVLAVLRRMLPHGLAWVIAAWWAVLPINYDTLYEVHLFSVLPILLAWVVILGRPGPWRRGIALAILLATAALVRNEITVAVLCLAAACFAWELRRRKRATTATRGNDADGERTPWRLMPTLAAYAIPLLLAVALSGFYFQRSYRKGAQLGREWEAKHTLNMSQVYAFGYKQRHNDWPGSAWTDSGALALRDFGSEQPTLSLMVRHNPRAVAAHFLWNLRLTPGGLQLMLFNVTAGTQPDYTPVPVWSLVAKSLSLLCVAVTVTGLWLLWRNRRWWWENWLRPRAWGWLAILCVAVVVAAVVIPTQRPRPSYLFSLAVCLMTLLSTCLFVIATEAARRWPALASLRRLGCLMPILMVAMPVLAPSRYKQLHPMEPRALFHVYERLRPYQKLIARPDVTFLGSRFPIEMREYIGLRRPQAMGNAALANRDPNESLAATLERLGVNVLYLDETARTMLDSAAPGCVTEFCRTGGAAGWRMIGFGPSPEESGARWMLFRRTPPPPRPVTGPTTGPTAVPVNVFDDFIGAGAASKIGAFYGWQPVSGLGALEGPYVQNHLPVVRWGFAPSSRIALREQGGGKFKLVVSAHCGIPNQRITVRLDGKVIAEHPWEQKGQFHDFSVPLDLSPGPHEIELVYATSFTPDNSNHLAILFRKLQVLPDDGGNAER